jgi:hypothetical protein
MLTHTLHANCLDNRNTKKQAFKRSSEDVMNNVPAVCESGVSVRITAT